MVTRIFSAVTSSAIVPSSPLTVSAGIAGRSARRGEQTNTDRRSNSDRRMKHLLRRTECFSANATCASGARLRRASRHRRAGGAHHSKIMFESIRKNARALLLPRERGDPLLRILRLEAAQLLLRFQLKLRAQIITLARVQRALDRADRERWSVSDCARERFGLARDVRRHAIHHPDRERLGRSD